MVVSYNGPAFVSSEYRTFLERNGVRAVFIPPYHPASNGAAERVVQTIKNKLKKAEPGLFETKIARVLLNYRTSPHYLTGRTPAELLMGRRLRTALDLLHPDLRTRLGFQQLQQKQRYDQRARKDPLPSSGARVWARNFRPGTPWVPGVVGEATSASSAEVSLPDGTVWNRHGDHLRHRAAPDTATSTDENEMVAAPHEPSPAERGTVVSETSWPPEVVTSAPPPEALQDVVTSAQTVNPGQKTRVALFTVARVKLCRVSGYCFS